MKLTVYAGNQRLAIACGDCNVRVWQMDHPRYVYKSQSLWKSIQSKVPLASTSITPLFAFIEHRTPLTFVSGDVYVLESLERGPLVLCHQRRSRYCLRHRIALQRRAAAATRFFCSRARCTYVVAFGSFIQSSPKGYYLVRCWRREVLGQRFSRGGSRIPEL